MLRVVMRFEGFVKEVTVDDKGMVLVVGFGVPPRLHDNDPERAVRAALTMQVNTQTRHTTMIRV